MKFYNCGCYFTHNIYIKDYQFHFKYINNEQFYKDYDNILSNLGCNSKVKKEKLLRNISDEVKRRKEKEKYDADRRNYIKENYQRLDELVYSIKEDYFHPTFIELVKVAYQPNSNKIFQLLDIISAGKQIYGFPVFNENFCQRIIRELEYYNESNMPKEQPNTMNKNGILLDDIGLHDDFSLVLRKDYLDPLAKILFPECRGQGLDSHKFFSVQYKSGHDTELGYHYDNSEVTLNVCLGKTFKGSELYFGDMNSVPISESTCILIKPKVGYGLLHRGQQLHGVLNIESGERYSLIMWMRSSSIRNKLCPMCNLKPSGLTPSLFYGDGFTLSDTEIREACYIT